MNTMITHPSDKICGAIKDLSCFVFWSLPEELKPVYFLTYLKDIEKTIEVVPSTTLVCSSILNAINYAHKFALACDNCNNRPDREYVDHVMSKLFDKVYPNILSWELLRVRNTICCSLIEWGAKNVESTIRDNPFSENRITTLLMTICEHVKRYGANDDLRSFYEEKIILSLLTWWDDNVERDWENDRWINTMLKNVRSCDELLFKDIEYFGEKPYDRLSSKIYCNAGGKTPYDTQYIFPELINSHVLNFNHFHRWVKDLLSGSENYNTRDIELIIEDKAEWLVEGGKRHEKYYSGDFITDCKKILDGKSEDETMGLLNLMIVFMAWDKHPPVFEFIFDHILENVFDKKDVFKYCLPLETLAYVNEDQQDHLLDSRLIDGFHTLQYALTVMNDRMHDQGLNLTVKVFNLITSYFNVEQTIEHSSTPNKNKMIIKENKMNHPNKMVNEEFEKATTQFIKILNDLPQSPELLTVLSDDDISCPLDKISEAVNVLNEKQIKRLLLVDFVPTQDGTICIYSLKKIAFNKLCLLRFGDLHEMSKRVSSHVFVDIITPLLLHFAITYNSSLEVSIKCGKVKDEPYDEMVVNNCYDRLSMVCCCSHLLN